jgi:hypothetical protein
MRYFFALSESFVIIMKEISYARFQFCVQELCFSSKYYLICDINLHNNSLSVMCIAYAQYRFIFS